VGRLGLKDGYFFPFLLGVRGPGIGRLLLTPSRTAIHLFLCDVDSFWIRSRSDAWVLRTPRSSIPCDPFLGFLDFKEQLFFWLLRSVFFAFFFFVSLWMVAFFVLSLFSGSTWRFLKVDGTRIFSPARRCAPVATASTPATKIPFLDASFIFSWVFGVTGLHLFLFRIFKKPVTSFLERRNFR